MTKETEAQRGCGAPLGMPRGLSSVIRFCPMVFQLRSFLCPPAGSLQMSLLKGPSGHWGKEWRDGSKTDKTLSWKGCSEPPSQEDCQPNTHRLAEVVRQMGPLRVVEDAVVLAFGAPRLRDHMYHAILTGHLEQWGTCQRAPGRGQPTQMTWGPS